MAQAGYCGNGNRVSEVRTDDSDGTQSRIEKKQNRRAESAGPH